MTVIDWSFKSDEGTLYVFAGTVEKTGRRVWFGIDRRIARDVLEVQPEALHIEPWQII